MESFPSIPDLRADESRQKEAEMSYLFFPLKRVYDICKPSFSLLLDRPVLNRIKELTEGLPSDTPPRSIPPLQYSSFTELIHTHTEPDTDRIKDSFSDILPSPIEHSDRGAFFGGVVDYFYKPPFN